MANRFAHWYAAGARSLIPVIPANAPLIEGRSEKMRAKSPGQPNAAGLWYPLRGWQDYPEPDTVQLATWERQQANVGLRLVGLFVLDLDEDRPEVAAAVAEALKMTLPDAPCRGRTGSSRVAWFYRWAGGEAPHNGLEWTIGGVPGALQFFTGGGHQMLIEGPHRDGGAYEWGGFKSRQDVVAAMVPVGAAELELATAAVRSVIAGLGGSAWIVSSGSGATEWPIDCEALAARDPTEAVKALWSIKCGDLVQRRDWVDISRSFKTAVRGDEAFYFEFDSWCEGWGPNTPEGNRTLWDGFHTSQIGADYLFRRANTIGNPAYTGPGLAGMDFAPVVLADSGEAVEPAKGDSWIQTYCYVLAIERYVDMRTMQMLTESAFKRLYFDKGEGISSSKANAAMIWQEHPDARKVASLTYRPGAERFVIEEGPSGGEWECLNAWRPPAVALPDTVTDADAAPWLDLAAYLLPDPVERGLLFDWAAYRLQHLDHKANFAVLFGSADEGTGKNLLMEPLRRGLGGRNVKGVDQSDVDGQWTDWAGNCVLVVIEEIHHFGKTTINKIKKYIPVPPATVRVNSKGTPHYEVPNAAAFLAYTNNLDALQLDLSDRRWLVLWSPAKPRDDAYYEGLRAWMRAGGEAAAVRWLLQRDLTGFRALGRAPVTAAKVEMRELAAHSVERWVTAAVREGIPPFDVDLVSIEVALDRLPRHLAKHMPTDKRVIAGIKAAGAVMLGQFRLGRSVGAGDRARIWAIREVERYQEMKPAEVAITYHEQQSGASATRAADGSAETGNSTNTGGGLLN